VKTGAANSAKLMVTPAPFIPKVPAWGAHVVKEMPLQLVFQHLPKNELFRLSWGARNTHGEEWEKLKQEYEARLEKMQKQALARKMACTSGIYGFWPANRQGMI